MSAAPARALCSPSARVSIASHLLRRSITSIFTSSPAKLMADEMPGSPLEGQQTCAQCLDTSVDRIKAMLSACHSSDPKAWQAEYAVNAGPCKSLLGVITSIVLPSRCIHFARLQSGFCFAGQVQQIGNVPARMVAVAAGKLCSLPIQGCRRKTDTIATNITTVSVSK